MMILLLAAAAAFNPQAEATRLLKGCDLRHVTAIVACYGDRFAEVDARLDELFAWERNTSAPYQDSYKSAQEAWRAWQKSQCSAEVEEEAASHAWGAKTGWFECAMELALQRIHEIEKQKRNLDRFDQMAKPKGR